MSITIGAITDVFGINGVVKVKPLVDDELIFKQLKSVALVNKAGNIDQKKVMSAKQHKGLWLIKLSGVNDPDDGQLLRGCLLQIEEGQLPPAGQGSVYWKDIQGAAVIDMEGKPVGTLADYMETGSHDVFEIAGADGISYMISNNPAHVINIDVDTKTVTIDRIGLVGGE
ncbi:MAG: ribosome maturation factor RimM [Deferribacteraceae bacterium]|jgi:16S rRNA processing protein RimM|nr:ribosome maturation factor RimM [Deferribacteraceae bacterium]